MPVLEWMGKDKVVAYHRQVPYRTLERIPEKGVLDSKGSDCGNKIIHGDNLEALKALLPEYEGRVDCIYIDPPYNTGNEGWIYNDNVNDPRVRKWLGQAVGKEGEDFSRHDKWLCMMYPRLQMMRMTLKETGVIFISIDDNECAALKYMCDEIFGANCFQGDISWQRTYSPRNDKHGMPVEVEHLMVYSMRPDWVPGRLERTDDMDDSYKSPDGDPRPWTSGDATGAGSGDHIGMVYAVQQPITGNLIYPSDGRHWANGQDQMLEIMNQWAEYELRLIDDAEHRAELCGLQDGKIEPIPAIMLKKNDKQTHEKAFERYKQGNWPKLFLTDGGRGGIRSKGYLEEMEGKLSTNLWRYADVGHTDEGAKELKAIFGGRAVFQNPKPSRLIRRVLRVACPPDGLMLDAFGGSGTTAQAVLQDNVIDHADRRFILIEMGDYASDITAERARRTISGYTTDKRRVDRLYEKKLTASNLKRCEDFYEAAVDVAENVPEGRYDKVEGPKMDGASIVVNGITNKGGHVSGVDSGFSYYELGPVLFMPDGSLNPEAPAGKLREYVWRSETRKPYVDMTDEHPYLLGVDDGTVYYLAYEPGGSTTLGPRLLSGLPRRGDTTVVYADRCVIDERALADAGIEFKRIPSGIARF